MSMFRVFSAPGRWFRGNCHTHTVLSDGKSTAKEVAQAYRRKGYDFLVLTDHHKAQASVEGLSTGKFLVINGIEMHPMVSRKDRSIHHIVGVGVDRTPPPGLEEKGFGADVVRWINRQGGIAIYGHPYWLGHTIEQMRTLRSTIGVEVYNSVCESTRGLGDSGPHLDMALSDGFRWLAFATDDVHRLDRDGFGGWIMVKARALTQQALMAAIRKGQFYATQGPEIRSIRLRRGLVRVETSPVRKMAWHSEGPAGTAIAARRGTLTEWEFPLKNLAAKKRYLRLEIMDKEGRKAWSNPVWRTRRGWGDL